MRRLLRARKVRWVLVAIIAVAAAATYAYVRWRGMPLAAWAALNGADRYELLSLHPYLSRPDYYGHGILGSTVVTDRAARERLNRAMQSGARESDGSMMACFNPRHGIRATRDGVTIDFVICFECKQVRVLRGGKKVANFLTSASPQPEFDEVLRKAGVPLAPKEIGRGQE